MIKNKSLPILLAALGCLPLLAQGLPLLPEGAVPLLIATNGKDVACSWSAAGPVQAIGQGDGYPSGKIFLSVGPKTIGPADAVRDLGWSADGKRLAYSLWSGKRIVLYIDHAKVAEFEARPYTGMNFRWAPKGSSFYAEGLKDGYSTLITPEGEARLGKAAASSSGSLEDGVLEVSRPGFADAAWTPDGARLFFLFTSRDGSSLYEGMRRIAGYEAAGRLAVSPTGIPAYSIRVGGEHFLLRGGEKFGPYRFVIQASWSPNGERLLYTVQNKDMTVDVYIDGKLMSGTLFGPMRSFNSSYGAWPPDGGDPAIAYDAFLVNIGGSMVFTGSERRGPYKSNPSGLLDAGSWAPKGRKLAYVAKKTDGTTWAFIGDEEVGPFDAASGPFSWSPNGESYCFRLGKNSLCVGGEAFETKGNYPYVTGWSPDSRILAYTTSTGPKVLAEGVEYAGAIFGAKTVVLEDGRFRFL